VASNANQFRGLGVLTPPDLHYSIGSGRSAGSSYNTVITGIGWDGNGKEAMGLGRNGNQNMIPAHL